MFIQDETDSLFDCDMLLLPFHTEDQWSLFIVLGASKIKDYSAKRYSGIRPCIIHLDFFEWTKTCHHSSNIADKIRTCLNCAWRKDNNEVDKLVMPFNKRSLPLCKPKGKYDIYARTRTTVQTVPLFIVTPDNSSFLRSSSVEMHYGWGIVCHTIRAGLCPGQPPCFLNRIIRARQPFVNHNRHSVQQE